jgi:hypothetical protein
MQHRLFGFVYQITTNACILLSSQLWVFLSSFIDKYLQTSLFQSNCFHSYQPLRVTPRISPSLPLLLIEEGRLRISHSIVMSVLPKTNIDLNHLLNINKNNLVIFVILNRKTSDLSIRLLVYSLMNIDMYNSKYLHSNRRILMISNQSLHIQICLLKAFNHSSWHNWLICNGEEPSYEYWSVPSQPSYWPRSQRRSLVIDYSNNQKQATVICGWFYVGIGVAQVICLHA